MGGRSKYFPLKQRRAILRLSYVQGFLRVTEPTVGWVDWCVCVYMYVGGGILHFRMGRRVYGGPQTSQSTCGPPHNMRHSKSVSGFQPLQKKTSPSLAAITRCFWLAVEGDRSTRQPLCLGRVLSVFRSKAPPAYAACYLCLCVCVLVCVCCSPLSKRQ